MGHGWLALQGKPLLLAHASMVGLGLPSLFAAGVLELVLAGACVVRPSPSLFVFAAAWKIATECLFVASGAPMWEFIERSGSYVAPIVAAAILAAHRVPVSVPIVRLRPAATLLAITLVPATPLAETQSTTMTTGLVRAAACRRARRRLPPCDHQPRA